MESLVRDFGNELNPLIFIVFILGLAIIPFLALCVSSYLKLSVVFGILKNAIGAQQVPSTAIVTLLSLVLTLHIMSPVINEIIEKIKQELLIDKPSEGLDIEYFLDLGKLALSPIETFLRTHSDDRERIFFANVHVPSEVFTPVSPQESAVVKDTLSINQAIACSEENNQKICVPKGENFFSLVPAFVLSELKEAFAIGFTIFLPFLVLDLVVATVLIGMGMMMLSPVTVSLPFKLLLFVLCDGWFLLSKGLILGYSVF